ncbi:MAG TPA: bifunctional acetate--CoA ligase family protein/GNAT family N-acetyltransferase [Thermosynechococcus sp. M3746_W2019_013]|uniref:bifunctional acetate--CoA ligase family protein/GNAT family N-acetyltransferase n=1 Tax=Thermosynechococcus sp. M3746_W2019_013 TaxID=2747806 RepID=UPI001A0C9CD4|nr:bifunctional acetate--CoA ligase family protein/GNAT family N-acetyltransferase [Thermosynechococcus sp. M3746_W2019_013]HIK22975.1 bifunctional acetate--CoA ligase family protein/GNAT family N-acetyltransferase [Thermosynechococcus sp. M3746_W2019_013]
MTRTTTYDIWRAGHQPLRPLFAPKSVAVIGASEKEGSVGRTLLWNLIQSPFGGTVFPVNPHRSSVLGIKAYASVTAIPEAVDLAVIATPAATVPAVVAECAAAGVKGAIIVSAGFREVGAAGLALEEEILTIARQARMRIIGPNCLGVMCPPTGLNATFAAKMARSGHVGFLSQSGALCTSILDWSLQENVGFSAFVSIGTMLDVGWGDLIYYLGDDPQTRCIVIYMESLGDARSFLSAAREVAYIKPIIVIKAGRTAAAAQAAASHTGALMGSDAVVDAALERCGVLRVETIEDLFDMAEVLDKQSRPKGPHLTILTNAGGPGVLATDALIRAGGKLSSLSADTLQALNQVLPPAWSHGNPVDILGDATADRYLKALQHCETDANSDGLLVVLTPQAMTDPLAIAQDLATYAQNRPSGAKPILASWMGGNTVKPGEAILNQAGIPTYGYADTAARIFSYMWRYSDHLQALYQTPALPLTTTPPNRESVSQLFEQVRSEGRTLLTEWEAKAVLAAYGLPVVETCIARSEAEAVAAADRLGYPVVLKLYSPTITHKTDVGGVALNLPDAAAVITAYQQIEKNVTTAAGASHFAGVTVQPMIPWKGFELIVGSSTDAQFGPVILFGTGGQLVEVLEDTAIALPPLNTTLARRLIQQTKISRAFAGVRGWPALNLALLEDLLVRFSLLVVEQPWIKEIDINPLLVAPPDRLLVLDARLVLHQQESMFVKPAIRPYPSQYVSPWQLRDGTPVLIRPIRPEDEPLMRQYHATLSEQSVYLRYFHLMKLSQRVAHDRLVRICFVDYDREMALVAEHQGAAGPEIIGVGRLSKDHFSPTAEFSLLISDRWQRQGLGTELLQRLIQIGRDEKLRAIHAYVLKDNEGMIRICRKLNFELTAGDDPSVWFVQLTL